MPNYSTFVYQTINSKDAKWGTKVLIKRNGIKLVVTIPPGVHSGTKVRLNGAMLLTDNLSGDIFVVIKVRSSFRQALVPVGILLALLIAVVAFGNDKAPSKTQNEKITRTNNSSETGEKNPSIIVNGKVITLINNPNATDPTYSQLMQFLKQDITDQNEYSEIHYNCVDFAKDLHDHAESKGIKSVWVGIDFVGQEVGHALNSFNTTDRGLVFIDVTAGVLEQTPSFDFYLKNKSWDTIAYIEIGKAYGVIDIDESSGPTYDKFIVFEESCRKLMLEVEEFYADVDAYNAALTNHNYSLGALNKWAEDLDNWQESLSKKTKNFDSCSYESPGIVEKIEITW